MCIWRSQETLKVESFVIIGEKFKIGMCAKEVNGHLLLLKLQSSNIKTQDVVNRANINASTFNTYVQT